eukprot:COSAG02_NODE_23425_length_719_cov_0.969355_1_plen_159_part_10
MVIQSVARGVLCRLRVVAEATQEMRREAAAVTIQAAVRGHHARARFRTRQSSVISVQAAWRGRRCRTELRQARLEDLSRQLLRIVANAKTHAALERWCDYVTETRRLREISTRVMLRVMQAKAFQIFTLWCDMTAEAREERLAAIIRLQAGARGLLCRR